MFILRLIDSKQRVTEFELKEPDVETNINIDSICSSGFVFADEYYKVLFIGEEHPISNVSFFINGEKVNSLYVDGTLCLTRNYERWETIFEDSYGYVQIKCNVEFSDNYQSIVLFSELIPIAVRDNDDNRAVQKMIEFVYENDKELLYGVGGNSESVEDLVDSGKQSLDAYIVLAENIVNVYEQNYGYFKANSRTQPIQVEVVDRIEKMQYATMSTIRYISTHPEYLRQSRNANCIQYGNSKVYPTKTLTSQVSLTKDVYENRVVVSFLKTMILNVQELKKDVQKIMDSLPKEEQVDDEYIFSSFVLAASLKARVVNYNERLDRIESGLINMYGKYKSMLKTTHIDVVKIPKPTHVLISVPQYNRIYSAIYKWFSYGKYDMANERFMMSFFKASELFEYYSLSRMIQGIKNRGYGLVKAYRYSYPVARTWLYSNTNCNNTYHFTNGTDEIVLYYQPVIFDFDSRKYNGIGLFRNTTISIGGQEGSYYSPDYLIKRITDDVESYLIVDSKFSTVSSVKKNYIVDLSYKYLISISPVDEKAIVVGLSMTYGKCESGSEVESVYNKQNPDYTITPFYELVPISEKLEEEQNCENIYKLLEVLMYDYS